MIDIMNMDGNKENVIRTIDESNNIFGTIPYIGDMRRRHDDDTY
jgi:hypothetical protein